MDHAIGKAIQKSEEMARTREENARITKELIQAKDDAELVKVMQQSALSGSKYSYMCSCSVRPSQYILCG